MGRLIRNIFGFGFGCARAAINESDILVLGTPIYGRNTTHHLQRLVERTFLNTLLEMYVEDGATRHPRRTKKNPCLVLVSTCGFPDLANFDHVRGLYRARAQTSGDAWTAERQDA